MLAFLKKCTIVVVIASIILAFLPGIPPDDVKFEQLNVEKQDLDKLLPENMVFKMNQVEILTRKVEGSSLGYFKGPESFAHHDGFLYTGIYGGEIIRLDLKHPDQPWQVVYKYGKPCTEIHQEEQCGRPLGLRFDTAGNLVVADTVYGIYRLDVFLKKVHLLVDLSKDVDGRPGKLANSVAVARDGRIFFTLSSGKFSLENGILEIISSGSPGGRLMEYCEKTKKVRTLIDNLLFANGVVVEKNDNFVIVSDIGRNRLLKYDLRGGTDDGPVSVLAHTPGFVDNLVALEDGKGFLAAVILPAPKGEFNLLIDAVYQYPALARFLARLIFNLKSLINFTNEKVWPHSLLSMASYKVANTEPFSGKKPALILQYNWSGKIVKAWQATSDEISRISEGNLINGYMYLGSPYNDFAARARVY